jgi:hypothetical protein
MKDDYCWWIAPVVGLLFTFPWILIFIGIPIPIAMGIYAVCVFGGAIFYSAKC